MGYIDMFTYMSSLPSIIISIIGILYSIFSVLLIVLEKKINKLLLYQISKILQIFFGSIFYITFVGNSSLSISNYFTIKESDNILFLAFAFLSLILFTSTAILHSFTRFDFLSLPSPSTYGRVRATNWSSATLQIYILINEITYRLATDSTTHIIIMSIALIFHTLVFILKNEHEEDNNFKIELSLICVNIVGVLLLLSIKVLGLYYDFGIFVLFSIMILISFYQLEFFNIKFEL